jgi:hypothetical protein
VRGGWWCCLVCMCCNDSWFWCHVYFAAFHIPREGAGRLWCWQHGFVAVYNALLLILALQGTVGGKGQKGAKLPPESQAVRRAGAYGGPMFLCFPSVHQPCHTIACMLVPPWVHACRPLLPKPLT